MSAARLLVLGVLRRHGKIHGYRIHQELMAWSADEWTSIKTSSIYHALNTLARQGMIGLTPSEDDLQGPQRTIFTLNSSGEAEFFKLLEQALQDTNLKTLAAGIAFMELLPRQRVLELLRINASAQTEAQAYVHKIPTAHSISTPALNPELVRLWANYHDSCANTVIGLIGRIEAGLYAFADDNE